MTIFWQVLLYVIILIMPGGFVIAGVSIVLRQLYDRNRMREKAKANKREDDPSMD